MVKKRFKGETTERESISKHTAGSICSYCLFNYLIIFFFCSSKMGTDFTQSHAHINAVLGQCMHIVNFLTAKSTSLQGISYRKVRQQQ